MLLSFIPVIVARISVATSILCLSFKCICIFVGSISNQCISFCVSALFRDFYLVILRDFLTLTFILCISSIFKLL